MRTQLDYLHIALYIAILAVILILFLFGLSLWHFLKTRYVLSHGTQVSGQIVKKRREKIHNRTGNPTIIFVVVFSYNPKNAMEVSTQQISQPHFDELTEGQRVPVLFLETAPHIAILGGDHVDYQSAKYYVQYLLLSIIATIIVVIALIIIQILVYFASQLITPQL